MEYIITEKVARVTITPKDVNEEIKDAQDLYKYFPQEIHDFINKNKNHKLTWISGRTKPYAAGDIKFDGITFFFEI